MIKIQEIKNILTRMSVIIGNYPGFEDWSHQLKFLAEKNISPSDLRYEIQKLYGGMGSLNDIVIFNQEGKMDKEANVEFDRLRSQLFDLSVCLK